MRDPNPLPEFLSEALSDDPNLDVEPVLRLPELLEPAGTAAGLERLLEAVREPPERYAPFISRLSLLWDLPEEQVCTVLERCRDPRNYRRTPLPGVKLIDVAAGPKTAGSHASLVRLSPGLHFPRHRHPGRECTFVLEGSYTDSNGRFVAPGDLHEMETGTEHAFVVTRGEPCVAAIVQVGIDFAHPFMRLLNKLFRR